MLDGDFELITPIISDDKHPKSPQSMTTDDTLANFTPAEVHLISFVTN